MAGRNLRGADLRRTDLIGADLRGADLRGANLRGADLKGADLRGADLLDADMGECSLHGADLRETRVGNADLGNRDGDPELTMIYNPEVWGAHADDDTRWPQAFKVYGAGIAFDGPHRRVLEGAMVNVPGRPVGAFVRGRDHLGAFVRGPDHRSPDASAPARGSTGTGRSSSGSIAQGRVRRVRGWLAHIESDAGPDIQVPGDRLIACNLQLLRGERAYYRSGWWSIVGSDDDCGTLAMEQGEAASGQQAAVTDVVRAVDLFEDNVRRWWWHVEGSEYTARS